MHFNHFIAKNLAFKLDPQPSQRTRKDQENRIDAYTAVQAGMRLDWLQARHACGLAKDAGIGVHQAHFAGKHEGGE